MSFSFCHNCVALRFNLYREHSNEEKAEILRDVELLLEESTDWQCGIGHETLLVITKQKGILDMTLVADPDWASSMKYTFDWTPELGAALVSSIKEFMAAQ
jgi:hypothetical protein